MAITQGLTTSFKVGLLCASFNFNTGTSQVYKMALYDSTASLGPTTTVYTTTGEITATGYTAGGTTLTIAQVPTSSGTVAYIDFDDPAWPGFIGTARGALIYLADGVTNPSVAVINFGADKTASNQTFTVVMPPPGATTALVRIK